MVASFQAGKNAPLEGGLILAGQSVPIEVRCLSYLRPDLPGPVSRHGKVITARFPFCQKARGPFGSLNIRAGTRTLSVGPLDLLRAVTDLKTLLRETLSGLDPETRANVMHFLAATPNEHRGTTTVASLGKNLFIVREALRERLPCCVNGPEDPQGLQIDAVMAVNERSFYIRGWMLDEEASITELTAVSPEGSRVELLGRIFPFARPDLRGCRGNSSKSHGDAKPGFLCSFELGTPSCLSTGWIVEMRNTAGTAVETEAPAVVRDSDTVLDTLLSDLCHERPPGEELSRGHIFPLLNKLQSQRQENMHIDCITQYGNPNPSPEASVIISLHGRIDFVEQQLAQFVHDSGIWQADLTYVLDFPQLADELRDRAGHLLRLYGVPFRVVILQGGAGFAGANNAGASLARGRLLLLLNSDVLPDRPGWLGRMQAFYDSKPGIGALGPKLLCEDDSLQHAGIYFSPSPDDSGWENRHCFKGLDRCLPIANTTRAVPAVSAACMMVDRELYKRVGGLRGMYLEQDYEASDLCLRLVELGRENWYEADVELYHLQGQSCPTPSPQAAGRYNRWLHTRLWRSRIEALMSRYVSRDASTPLDLTINQAGVAFQRIRM